MELIINNKLKKEIVTLHLILLQVLLILRGKVEFQKMQHK